MNISAIGGHGALPSLQASGGAPAAAPAQAAAQPAVQAAAQDKDGDHDQDKPGAVDKDRGNNLNAVA